MPRALVHEFSATGRERRCVHCGLAQENEPAIGRACLSLVEKVRRAWGAEHIICAAVWFDDGVAHVHQPVPRGIVVGGWRHHACIEAVSSLAQGHGEVYVAQRDQGFLTSRGRFVGREEAAKIAWDAGQTARALASLTSEDLY